MNGPVGIAVLFALGFSTLALANLVRDHVVDPSVARRVAAIGGGGAYLVAVVSFDAWIAISVPAAALVGMLAARSWAPHYLRGVSSDVAGKHWSEVAYLAAATASLAVGWGFLEDRWLAFLPIAFMAWGDNAAGLVRAAGRSAARDPRPSMAMLGVCLAAALLYQPYLVAAAGAVSAVAAERFQPTTHPLWDDNWVIVVASLGAMAMLLTLVPPTP